MTTSYKQKFSTLLAACAVVGSGMIATSTPAEAFYVDEFRLQSQLLTPTHIQKKFSPKYVDDSKTQVFLNEVDPTYKVRENPSNHPDFTPLLAKYEIAAPNGTDLTGWKFQIFESKQVNGIFEPRRDYAYLMEEHLLSEVLSNKGKFTDQQQGWGFGTFTGYAPKAPSYVKEADPRAHYVIVDDKGKVVQALAYRHEALIVGDVEAAGYTTKSIRGYSHYYRKNMDKYEGAKGSWKLNNVFMTPNSTYGSLQTVRGLGSQWFPDGNLKMIQWFTPKTLRYDPTPSVANKALPDRWGMINFEPTERPSYVLECLASNAWMWKLNIGPNICENVGDDGYLFDTLDGNPQHDQIKSIPNKKFHIGEQVDIKVTDDRLSKELIKFTWDDKNKTADQLKGIGTNGLPEGLTFDKTTGRITGTIKKHFEKQRFVLSADNWRSPAVDGFVTNDFNGHGITFRTFFWEIDDNRAPVITFFDKKLEAGRGGVIDGIISDPDGDSIVDVAYGKLPAGIKLDISNKTAPKIIVDKTVPKGDYTITVKAQDEHGAVGTKTYTFRVDPARNIDIKTTTLRAKEGETKSVPVKITEPDNAPLTVDFAAGNVEVPKGVTVTSDNKGGYRLSTNGHTPKGTYNLNIRAKSTHYETIVPVVVLIENNDIKIGLDGETAFTVTQGIADKYPFSINYNKDVHIYATSNAPQTIYEYKKTGNSNYLIIPKTMSVGQHQIRIIASDPDDSTIRTEKIVTLKVVPGDGSPSLGVTKTTVTLKDKGDTIVPLKLNNGNSAYVTLISTPHTNVPRGFEVKPGGWIIIRDWVEPGVYKLHVSIKTGSNETIKDVVTITVE